MKKNGNGAAFWGCFMAFLFINIFPVISGLLVALFNIGDFFEGFVFGWLLQLLFGWIIGIFHNN